MEEVRKWMEGVFDDKGMRRGGEGYLAVRLPREEVGVGEGLEQQQQRKGLTTRGMSAGGGGGRNDRAMGEEEGLRKNYDWTAGLVPLAA